MGKKSNLLNVSLSNIDNSNSINTVNEINYKGQKNEMKFPLLPLKDISPFPGMVMPIFVGREKSKKAIDYANSLNGIIFLVTQKDSTLEEVEKSDLYDYGVLAEIKQVVLLPDQSFKVLFECKKSAFLVSMNDIEYCGIEGSIKLFDDLILLDNFEEKEVLQKTLKADFDKLMKTTKSFDEKVASFLGGITDSFEVVYYIAERINLSPDDRQKFLSIHNEKEILEVAILKIDSLLKIIDVERRVKNRLKNQIEKNQKDYYLTEQMKAIQKELGDFDDTKEEISKLEDKINTLKLSDHARSTALTELKKLKHMNQFSSEYSIIKNYLDFLTALPWGVYTDTNKNLHEIKKILDDSHFGIEEVKERVYELIVQKNRVKNQTKSTILCFYGPPGIGKTSFAYAIGKAIGYKTISIPLGGVKDESVLRGHRRTYIGSMPGKIIQAVKDAGSSNLVIVLDEIGSIGSDWRGNPEDVLLEILDPTQNKNFQDNYLGTGFDLSGIIFVATTNYLDTIKPALLDRLEIISLSGYTQEEKNHISKTHLIPNLLKEYGLESNQFIIKDDVLNQVIRNYTYESGVRGLEKQLSKLVRKSMREIEETGVDHIDINNLKLYEFLKKPIYLPDEKKESRVGMVNGLAYVGKREGQEGEVLLVESSVIHGDFKVEFTGNLGNMMKESIQIAFKKLILNADEYQIDIEDLKKKNIYVNFPSGGTPKDGPSAGVAIFCAMFSAVKGIKFPNEVAMTGEISLYNVLKVGGIKEKLLAAYRNGIKKVFIPRENVLDLEDLSKDVLNNMEVVLIKHPEEVIKNLGLF